MTEDTNNRALRLKTLGNAVCPPQAYPIFQYIAMIETGACVNICPYGTGGDAP
jgi:DNA (cytosine-5)-methyltransferase 1